MRFRPLHLKNKMILHQGNETLGLYIAFIVRTLTKSYLYANSGLLHRVDFELVCFQLNNDDVIAKLVYV